MRRILNLFITGLVLWIGTQFFPSIVQIEGFATLAIAAILIWIVSLIVIVASALIMVLGVACGSPAWVLLGLGIALCADVVTLYILTSALPGFAIIGFWPKVIIAICCNLFHIAAPSDQNYNNYNY